MQIVPPGRRLGSGKNSTLSKINGGQAGMFDKLSDSNGAEPLKPRGLLGAPGLFQGSKLAKNVAIASISPCGTGPEDKGG